MAIDQHERQALESVWRQLEPHRRDESRIGILTPSEFRLNGFPLRFIGVSECRGSNSREKVRIGIFVPVFNGTSSPTADLPVHVDAAVLVRILTSEEREHSPLSATNQRVAELLGCLRRETGDLVTLERLGPKEIFGII